MTVNIGKLPTARTRTPGKRAHWPVVLSDAARQDHVLRLPYEEGDPAPTWQRVADHLATLAPDHDLHDAHLEKRLTVGDWGDLFFASENRAIRDADRGIGEWPDAARETAGEALRQMESRAYIDAAHPRAELMLRRLERAELIAEGRADTILARALNS